MGEKIPATKRACASCGDNSGFFSFSAATFTGSSFISTSVMVMVGVIAIQLLVVTQCHTPVSCDASAFFVN